MQFCSCFYQHQRNEPGREWERVALFDDANTVFLMQDSHGLIWFGTSQGLYDFDGYNCHPHFRWVIFQLTYIVGWRSKENCGLRTGCTYL